MQDKGRDKDIQKQDLPVEKPPDIYAGTPEAEYLHWQFEACGKRIEYGENLNVTFDKSFLMHSYKFKGTINRYGKEIIVIPSQTHMPYPREVFDEDDNVIEELSWYPDPMPNYGETWMTTVSTYWALEGKEYITIKLVKKLTERSL